jgi:hypothetical protein
VNTVRFPRVIRTIYVQAAGQTLEKQNAAFINS